MVYAQQTTNQMKGFTAIKYVQIENMIRRQMYEAESETKHHKTAGYHMLLVQQKKSVMAGGGGVYAKSKHVTI